MTKIALDPYNADTDRTLAVIQPDAAAAPTATLAAVPGYRHVIFGWEAVCDTAGQTVTETVNGKTITYPIGVQTLTREYTRPLECPVNTAFSVGVATGTSCKVRIRGITVPSAGPAINVTSA